VTTSGDTATDTADALAEPGTGSGPDTAPTRSDEWLDLLGETTAKTMRPDLFDAAFSDIAQVLHDNSDAKRTVSQLIESHDARTRPELALAQVTESLQYYLGVDGAFLIHWLVYADVSDRLDQIQAAAPAPVVTFLRNILAEHGATLDFIQRAAVLGGVNDWINIEKRAFIDGLTGKQIFTITLYKIDGSILRLECSPDSIMNLAGHVLELVNATGSLRAYNSYLLQRFTDQLHESMALISTATEEADAATE
jgi:hypothetical protein